MFIYLKYYVVLLYTICMVWNTLTTIKPCLHFCRCVNKIVFIYYLCMCICICSIIFSLLWALLFCIKYKIEIIFWVKHGWSFYTTIDTYGLQLQLLITLLCRKYNWNLSKLCIVVLINWSRTDLRSGLFVY